MYWIQLLKITGIVPYDFMIDAQWFTKPGLISDTQED